MLALVFIPMSGSQTAVQYDPWADMNDDGKIDIKDIAYSSRLFGTLGDPTKNVNVTNWPTHPPYKVITVFRNYRLEIKYSCVPFEICSGWLNVGGYYNAVVYVQTKLEYTGPGAVFYYGPWCFSLSHEYAIDGIIGGKGYFYSDTKSYFGGGPQAAPYFWNVTYYLNGCEERLTFSIHCANADLPYPLYALVNMSIYLR
jgi:hypothetical protein